jgi:hypothetical protein
MGLLFEDFRDGPKSKERSKVELIQTLTRKGSRGVESASRQVKIEMSYGLIISLMQLAFIFDDLKCGNLRYERQSKKLAKMLHNVHLRHR